MRKAEFITQYATPEIIQQLDDGDLSINAAYKALKEEVDELRKQADEFNQERASAARKIESGVRKNHQLEERIEQIVKNGEPELVNQIEHYRKEAYINAREIDKLNERNHTLEKCIGKLKDTLKHLKKKEIVF